MFVSHWQYSLIGSDTGLFKSLRVVAIGLFVNLQRIDQFECFFLGIREVGITLFKQLLLCVVEGCPA